MAVGDHVLRCESTPGHRYKRRHQAQSGPIEISLFRNKVDS